MGGRVKDACEAKLPSAWQSDFLSQRTDLVKNREISRAWLCCCRPVAWDSSLPSHPYLLNPLSAPRWRIKGLGEVLCFVHDFTVLKLHDADGVERASLVDNRVFRNPQFARSEKPPNAEACRLAGVMAAKVLQILSAVYAFTGLWVVTDDMLVVDLMLDILIAVRRSCPVLTQSGFD